MKTWWWLFLIALAARAGEPVLLLELTGEGVAIGDRQAFQDHSTLSDGSFAGVSGRTASPWDGGWRAYEVTVGNDDSHGFWMERALSSRASGLLTMSFDLMADERALRDGAALTLLGERPGEPGWPAVVTLGFGKEGLILAEGRRHQAICLLEPRRWYRVILNLAPGDASCTVSVQAAGEERASLVTLERQAAVNLAATRLKIASGVAPKTFYLDNLRVLAAPAAE